MTAAAARDSPASRTGALVVPVTTRTPEQWRRVALPGPPPRYAVTANGGIAARRRRIDDARGRAALRRRLPLSPAAPRCGSTRAACAGPEWTARCATPRACSATRCSSATGCPPGLLAEAAAWADGRGWQLSLQGRKLYWVPRPLTKSAAVAEVAPPRRRRPRAAAGDSLLDADLLEAADAGIVARHGELVASGWRAPHVASPGDAARWPAQEIVAVVRDGRLSGRRPRRWRCYLLAAPASARSG